jgi:hypothetical protein
LDRKVLIGIGIGLIIATLALSGSSYNNKLTKAQIEEKASSYGMQYPQEEKVILKKEVTK